MSINLKPPMRMPDRGWKRAAAMFSILAALATITYVVFSIVMAVLDRKRADVQASKASFASLAWARLRHPKASYDAAKTQKVLETTPDNLIPIEKGTQARNLR